MCFRCNTVFFFNKIATFPPFLMMVFLKYSIAIRYVPTNLDIISRGNIFNNVVTL